MSNNKIFVYENTEIANRVVDGIEWWSLTSMAKVNNSRVQYWLENIQTQQYLDILVADMIKNGSAGNPAYPKNGYGGNPLHPIIVIGDGPNETRGTWTCNRNVVLAFAMWVSPAFHYWVTQQIDTLITTGKVESNVVSRIDTMINEIVFRINTNNMNYGRKLGALFKMINGKSFDYSATLKAVNDIINQSTCSYDLRNKMFKTLEYMFSNYVYEKKTKYYLEQCMVLDHINSEWLEYRGRSRGQLERSNENLKKALETK